MTEITYKVDDAAFTTDKPELKVKKILEIAGFDPAKFYLIEVQPKEESFKGRDNEAIHMVENMLFITAKIGPTPVSSLPSANAVG